MKAPFRTLKAVSHLILALRALMDSGMLRGWDAERLRQDAHSMPPFTLMQVEPPELKGAGNMSCGI